MLNQKQILFCQYLIGECKGDKAQAAIKAGYKPASARTSAAKLLKRRDVQEYITQLNAEVAQNYTQKVAECVKYNIASIAEIQGFWTKIMNDEEEPMRNRIRASELLAKAKGMFNTESW